MTEGISQEAREAYIAYEQLEGRYAHRVRMGNWDRLRGVQAMQSLINSTIDRCAAVTYGELVHIFEDTPDETDAICNSTVREIARCIRQMKGATNV